MDFSLRLLPSTLLSGNRRATYRLELTSHTCPWIRDSRTRAEAVRDLVKRLPQFAPAWMELVFLTDQKDERLAAIENGLAANPDPETKGILQINKALTLNTEGDKQGAVLLLGNLVLDPNSTLGTETLAKFSLANILK